jgi:hypothetical protein
MDQDLCIGPGPEAVTVAFELCAQFEEVIDLSVEYDPDALFGVGHGLVTALEIDDGEAPEAEP